MSLRVAMLRPHRVSTAAGLAALVAGAILLAGGSWAAPPSPSSYPSASLFRTLQQLILNCSRDNTAAQCDLARSQADGLLDHPRLSSSCKDILWSIRTRATTALANSLERRDRIDRTARDLPLFCRQPAAAIGSDAAGRAPAPGSPAAGPSR